MIVMATPTDPTTGSFEPTPPSTLGFGPREDADTTRQAQHALVNDAPVDVNMNAVLARSQAFTVDVFGKTWSSNSDRREKMADDRYNKSSPTP